MKITKQQRLARDKAVQRASIAAIRQHFTGAGAKARSLRFVRDWLSCSGSWLAKFVCLASWAAVAGVLVGPDHARFMAQLHAWMVVTPVNDVMAQAQSVLSITAVELVKLSLVIGLFQKLLIMVKPAVEEAKASFNQLLA